MRQKVGLQVFQERGTGESWFAETLHDSSSSVCTSFSTSHNVMVAALFGAEKDVIPSVEREGRLTLEQPIREPQIVFHVARARAAAHTHTTQGVRGACVSLTFCKLA
jgi:hypothetical protein